MEACKEASGCHLLHFSWRGGIVKNVHVIQRSIQDGLYGKRRPLRLYGTVRIRSSHNVHGVREALKFLSVFESWQEGKRQMLWLMCRQVRGKAVLDVGWSQATRIVQLWKQIRCVELKDAPLLTSKTTETMEEIIPLCLPFSSFECQLFPGKHVKIGSFPNMLSICPFLFFLFLFHF